MRILIVIHQFFPEFSSGTERVALNLAKMAQHAGHHVRILTCAIDLKVHGGVPSADLAGAMSTVFDGVPITLLSRDQLPASADYSLDADEGLAARLASWIRDCKFDLAHVMHCMRMGSALLAIQEARLPYVLTLTDFYLPCPRINLTNLSHRLCDGPEEGRRCGKDCQTPPWTPGSLERRYQQARAVAMSAGACIAPSSYVARRYQEAFPGLHVDVIPHGVDMLAIVRTKVMAPPAESGRPLQLVFIGTAVPQKGLSVLLRSLARIPAARLQLSVAGPFHGDPVYLREVRMLAAADSRVVLLGSLDQNAVFELIHTMDLLCLPSLVPESFSLVLHECAAASIPALVSDLGAPSETVAQSGAGRALAAGDVGAWADALTEVISQPGLLRSWKDKAPLSLRIEEEAFFYESIYRRLPPPESP